MTIGGWIFMSSSLVSVITLATFCYYRVLRTDPEDSARGDDDVAR